jgi:hypothetical protein
VRAEGDPGHDDYGLPPVDVVIPDDARELERDLIAYRRELRRERRQDRLRRVWRPFGRFGVAVPLLAGAVLVALISGTLLTLGARPTSRPTTDPVAAAPAAGPGRPGGLLPTGTVTEISGRERQDRSVLDLRSGVIGIVPPDCRCESAVTALAKAARVHVVNFWLVADRRQDRNTAQQSRRELRALAGVAHDGLPRLIEDSRNVLAAAYAPPAGTPNAGLTAVLVHTDGVVAEVLVQPRPAPQLLASIGKLRGPSTRQPA